MVLVPTQHEAIAIKKVRPPMGAGARHESVAEAHVQGLGEVGKPEHRLIPRVEFDITENDLVSRNHGRFGSSKPEVRIFNVVSSDTCVLTEKYGASVSLDHPEFVSLEKHWVHTHSKSVALQSLLLIPEGRCFSALEYRALINRYVSRKSDDLIVQVDHDAVRKKLDSIISATLHVSFIENAPAGSVPSGFIVFAGHPKILRNGGGCSKGIGRLFSAVSPRDREQFSSRRGWINLLRNARRGGDRQKATGKESNHPRRQKIGVLLAPACPMTRGHDLMDSH